VLTKILLIGKLVYVVLFVVVVVGIAVSCALLKHR
jgi:hypothetical protein